MAYEENQRMNTEERDYVQHLFGKHISHGQVRYLRCAHLDIYERDRKGCTVKDAVSGRRFYDCFSSAGCFNVGRGNDMIRKALAEALDSWDMGSHQILSAPKVEFAAEKSDESKRSTYKRQNLHRSAPETSSGWCSAPAGQTRARAPSSSRKGQREGTGSSPW